MYLLMFFLEEGGGFFEYPYYSVRAPKFCATDNAIYEFSHWSSPNGKATFDPNNVDNYAGCGVRFDQDGAVVKPNYVAVNNQTNYTFMIQSNETLTIPANANIQCADGFTIDVQPYGTLIADGTSGQIILSGDCMATTLNDPIIDEVAGIYGVPSSEMNKLISVSVNGNVQLRNAKIEGYHVGLYVEADHFLTLKNVEIADCNIGIYVDSNSGVSTLEIDSCHIHNCDIGVYFHPEVYDENVLIHHSLFHDIDCYGLFVYYGNGSSSQSVNFLDHPFNLLVDFCSFIDCGIDDSYNSDYRSGILICNNSVWDYYFYGQINAYIRNSIFYNAPFYSNDDEEDYIELNGVKNIYYLSGYDWPEALGVAYYVNPYFVDYGNGDFRIKENSYAVDHGTFANPLSGIFPQYSYATDPDGTAPDIGAIYYPQVTIDGGDFSGDIASYGKVTVIGNMNLTGNVYVPEPVEMVIPAGKTVSAASDKSIHVSGILVIDGDLQSPVVFNNVSIYVGSEGCADMEYANITSAGLQVSYGKVNLSHCSISNSDNNTDGLCALYLNPTSSIENCSFVNNSRYGAYMMGGITWLEDCEISGHDNYPGLRLVNYNGVLQDNWITDNYDGIAFISGNANLNGGYYSEDQVIGLGSVNEAILNNIIANNTRYGISISSAATPIIGTANYWEPDGEMWFGGSNAFFDAGGDYYIYSANSGTVYARSNFWDQEEYIEDLVDGNISLSPCYYIDASLSKPTGGTKSIAEHKPKYRPTTRDLLIIKADSLLMRKNYEPSVKEYERIIGLFPDDQIARTALNRIVYIFENLEQTERELEYLENLRTVYKNRFIGMLAYDLSSQAYLKNQNFERAFAINEEVAQSYSEISEHEFAAMALYENLIFYELIAMDSLSVGSLAKKCTGSAQSKVMEYRDRILNEYPETGAAKMLREQYKIPEPEIPVELPVEYALKSCYPNPFNPVTNISFDLPEESRISIVVYDLIGRKIWELPDNNFTKPAGSYTYQWDGCNLTGAQVASGVYFIHMHTAQYSKIGKVMFIK